MINRIKKHFKTHWYYILSVVTLCAAFFLHIRQDQKAPDQRLLLRTSLQIWYVQQSYKYVLDLSGPLHPVADTVVIQGLDRAQKTLDHLMR